MSDDRVVGELDRVYDSVRGSAITDGQFGQRLNQLLDSLQDVGVRLQCEIRRGSHLVVQYGPAASNGWQQVRQEPLQLAGLQGSIVYCSRQAAAPGSRERADHLVDKCLPKLSNIIQAFWGNRHELTLLLDRQRSEHSQQVEAAVRDGCVEGKTVVLAHLDLDGLKQINNLLNYDEGGSKAISEFGSRLRESFADDAILMAKGGDEFLAIWIGQPLPRVLMLLDGFRQRMFREPLSISEDPKTCTIAVAAHPHHVKEPLAAGWFKTLLDIAMPKEKVDKNNTGRNLIVLPDSPPTGKGVGGLDAASLTLAALVARECLSTGVPAYGDDFHNFLALAMESAFSDAKAEELADRLAEVLRAARWQQAWDGSGLGYSSTPLSASPWVHPVKCASIVLHALLRTAFRGVGPLRPSDRLVLQVGVRNSSVKHLRIQVNRDEGSPSLVLPIADIPTDVPTIDVFAGRPWYSAESLPKGGLSRLIGTSTGSISLSPVLLVGIGDDARRAAKASLLSRISAASVWVDSRPVTQGGLPDFWQSNLSRIIEATLRNPNISHVLVVGDADHAKRTVELLRSPNSWDVQSLTKQLGIDARGIQQFQFRAMPVHLAEIDSQKLLAEYRKLFFDDEAQLKIHGQARDLAMERKQQRPLKAPTSPGLALGGQHGLEATTLAEAYPMVISILRSSQQRPVYSDQTGRKYRELSAFKLVLSQPTGGQVPSFWEGDKDRLEEYFEREFSSDAGTFGRRLFHWGNGALKEDGSALDRNQVVEAVEAAGHAVLQGEESRRIAAFLAEPHDEAGPLGLVSVHLFPRRRNGKWYLDFHWVWRTVEALVGLAFSAYGSIKESEALVRAINDEFGNVGGSPIHMGEITYIALSLHMFLDRGDLEVARTIVIEALE